MEKEGLVEVVRIEREGNPPERTVYGITATDAAGAAGGGRGNRSVWCAPILRQPVKEVRGGHEGA